MLSSFQPVTPYFLYQIQLLYDEVNQHIYEFIFCIEKFGLGSNFVH